MTVEFFRDEDGFRLRSELFLPQPIEAVFAFFADAGNLDAITPNRLRFEILTPRPIAMQVGTMIDYQLKVRGIPLKWRSEITVWDPPNRFVDEQRRGPYRKWIHAHMFEAREGGTLVIDDVLYMPRGGALVNKLFVQRDVRAIFEHRSVRLNELFGVNPPNA